MFIPIQLLVFLTGSMPLLVFADEAKTVVLEDETATEDIGDSNSPEFTEAPTPLSTIAETFQSLMTTDSIVATEDGGNATDPGDPETSDDGLESATLVGIILGIIVAIGVATAIIIMVVKKMSRL